MRIEQLLVYLSFIIRMIIEALQDSRVEVEMGLVCQRAGELIRRSIFQEWEDRSTCWNNPDIESLLSTSFHQEDSSSSSSS